MSMAYLSYVHPAAVKDDQMRKWLEDSIRVGRPGPEIQAIRAHHPGVMRSFNLTREELFQAGTGFLELELKELVRVRIATSLECKY